VLSIAIAAPFAAIWWHAEPEVWPWALASTSLEVVYVVALAYAYRTTDVSFVYPLTRGIAPVLVLIVAVVFLGPGASAAEAAGVANVGSFTLALLALRHGPAAPVLAVRSSSVVIATVLAGRLLAERVSRGRLAGSILVFAGIALLAT